MSYSLNNEARHDAEQTSMQVDCLVSYGESRKIITLSGTQRLADLRASLLDSEFAYLVDEHLLIQVYNDRFKCFVDLDPEKVLEDGARINLLLGEAHHGPPVERPTNRVLQVLPQTENRQDGAKSVDQYTLPQMPLHIASEVRSVKQGDVPDKLRKKIVDWIAFDMSTHLMYPKKLYSAAAKCLVDSHPQLKDSSENGYASWYFSLRNKFKNIRKRMPPGCPEVDAQKEKVKLRKLAEGTQCGNSFRRETVVETTFEMDPIFVNQTVNFMKKELQKTTPNMELIKDAMDRTAPARRRALEIEKLNLNDFLQVYPALKVDKEICNECYRLTGIPVDVKLLEALREHSDGIFDAARCKQSALSVYCEVMSEVRNAEGIAKNYARGVGALILLPLLLNERGENLFSPLVPGKRCLHPTVIYNGSSPLKSEAMHVAFEDICIDVLDLTEGFCVVFCMYWAYSIEYAPALKHTFCVIEHLLEIKKAKLGARALKLLTKLRAQAGKK